jgi:hypothetical protein
MENENGAIKRQLYDLFFVWRDNKNNHTEHEDHDLKSASGLEKKSNADKIEKEKRAQLKKEQAK